MPNVSFIRTLFVTITSLVVCTKSSAQRAIPVNYTGPVNYVRTWEAVAPETNPDNLTVATTLDKAKMTSQYIDGLGRPIQTVTKAYTSLGKDMVAAVEYDEYGREQFKYLPYASTATDGMFKINPFQQQSDFYNTTNAVSPIKGQGQTWFYGQTQYEASPLNRVNKTLSPGNSWIKVGVGINSKYWFNTLTDDVKVWKVFTSMTNNNYNLQVGITNNGNGTQTAVYSWSGIPTNASTVMLLYRAIGSSSWNSNSGSITGPRSYIMPVGNYEYAIQVYFSDGTSSQVFIATNENPKISYTTSGTYQAGQLYKFVTEDEAGKQQIVFKDKSGKIILKKVQLGSDIDAGGGAGYIGWLCTYYIYDELGNLRFVLPPKAVEAIQGSWSISDDIKNELCFYYGYDAQNRMTVKRVPGAAEVWMVYDKRDRLVMTQDGNLRASGKWLVTIYDELNRPVKTGLWTESNDRVYHEAAATSCQYYYYPCLPPTPFEILTETGYDDYSLLPTGAPTTSLDITNITSTNFFTTYDASPYAQQLIQSYQTRGMVTWTKVKVLGSSPEKFLYSVNIYDDKGKVIQVKSKNITDGIDVATTQYDFSGKVLRTHVSHQKAGVNANTYLVLTTNKYDAGGRLTDVIKKIGSQNEVTIAKNTYDELGQLSKKELGKIKNTETTYTNSAIETLSYDYNIRGWMLGANRDYAKSTSSTSNYFGYDLGYDNTNIATSGGSVLGSYLVPQLNGNITGMVWKSTGDDQVRKYDYSYDNVNRLTAADFNQYTSSAFNKTAGIDYSVSSLSYDANGNILTQKQMGWKLSGSTMIDDLRYTYSASSNKLQSVTDFSNDAQTKLGDFRTSSQHPQSTTKSGLTAASTQSQFDAITDYQYDVNGNLIKDKNKDIETYSGANGIEYNYLNLPTKITIKASGSANKGTIEYTYDASGNKIKKLVSETGKPQKTTLYLFGTYEDDQLQFLPMEEGRIRLTTSTTTPFVFDYMIKDHLGNVRMVLTEEQQLNYYPAATLEGSQVTDAKSMVNWEKRFYSIDNTKITATSSIPGWSSSLNYANNNAVVPNNITSGSYPSSYTVTDAATSTNMYKLNGLTNKTGLGFVIKVMAGDKMDIFGKSYFSGSSSYTNDNSSTMGLADIFNTFLNTISNPATATGMSEQNLETINTGSYAVPSSFIRGTDNTTSTSPKAYINYILFDDQFRYVTGGFSRVGNSGTVKSHWSDASLQNIVPDKNGYLYVYVSNESNTDVFFDNLQVVHKRSPILEETHYYPFGLTMAGISSKAAAGIINNKGYNGNELQNKEFTDGSGLEFYDFNARGYEQQIGRFMQIDPLSDLSVSWSPFTFVSNNPINRNDPAGLKDTLVNGKNAHIAPALDPVVVTSKKKSYQQSTLGQLWRRYSSHYSGVSTGVSNLYQLGANSMLRREMIWLTGDLLEKVKNDVAMQRHQQRIIALLKSDPRFKKATFIYSNMGESVEFGGQRAAGEDWFGLSGENPLLHKETWEVAANPLTWTLRHANVQTDAIVKEDGTIVLNHYVSDKLDLRPGDGHTPAYNKVTSVLGPIYHDALRGSDNMQVRGSWSITVNQ